MNKYDHNCIDCDKLITHQATRCGSCARSKEKSPNWKGNGACYDAFHIWLKYRHGKANHCENQDCNGKSKKYEWALIKGKTYEHKRENYMQLCKSCHVKYDMTEYHRESLRKRNKGNRYRHNFYLKSMQTQLV